MTGYERLRELQRDLRASGEKLTVRDLLVLAPQHDPFNVGSPAHLGMAQWFVELWERHQFPRGVHLRRIHYRIVDTKLRQYNGKPYENTEGCFIHLCEAAKYARYLDLVPADAFDDRRNPDVRIYFHADDGGSPEVWVNGEPTWTLPGIPVQLAWHLNLEFPTPQVEGYGYRDGDQPYHLEIWIEKTTMNDVLLPICWQHGVNLVPAAGLQSMSNVVAYLQRVAKFGKPARVFYISDFDPAGMVMPVQVARQIEFLRPKYAPQIEIKLTPIALSRQQVVDLGLPRIPLKDTDKRKGNFEERHGEGAVELDALEAHRPGLLAELVKDAIQPYRDEDLEASTMAAGIEALSLAHDAWHALTADQQAELDAIKAEARAVLESYEGELAGLAERLKNELRPMHARLQALLQVVREQADAFDVELPEVEPDIEPVDEEDWLFASDREYLEQLARYTAYKDGAVSE